MLGYLSILFLLLCELLVFDILILARRYDILLPIQWDPQRVTEMDCIRSQSENDHGIAIKQSRFRKNSILELVRCGNQRAPDPDTQASRVLSEMSWRLSVSHHDSERIM